MTYDNAGNLTNDTYSGQGQRNYDAENRMTQAWANSQWQTYTYDASGQRVKRNVNGTETWAIYGPGGELVAEYAANASTSSPQKEYGYRNGQLLITATVSASGWGPPPGYTPPDPLVTGWEIKLEHLTELRSAVNQLRAHAGLSAFNFTLDPNPERNVTTVKAEHIRQLRTALEDARSHLGLSIGGYAHPTLTENSSWIYAIDFQELRNQIASAWNSGSGAIDIRWLVTDQLGTPRMIIDKTGALANVKRHDYLPFGEELLAYQGLRTPALGYADDNIRQKFTSKERDNETGLDYFLARYYSSTQGRFTSPDEFTGGPDELYYFAEDALANPTFYADLRKPQSLNKYQYSFNNPLRYVDPDGHDPEEPEPQDPKPVVPVPVPIGPGLPPLPIGISPAIPGPSDQQIIRGVESVLDTVTYYTGIDAVADWLRPKIMPSPAPTTTTPPTQNSQPLPPPAPILSKKDSVRTATRTPGGVAPGKSVSDKQAADRLKSGGDVTSSSRAKAKQVAKKASSDGAVVHDRSHRPGFRPHYHDKKRDNGHSFYD